MAAEPEQEEAQPEDREALYWCDVFQSLGMRYAQALTLAYDPVVDRHGVRVVLERGCDPDVAFLIFSS